MFFFLLAILVLRSCDASHPHTLIISRLSSMGGEYSPSQTVAIRLYLSRIADPGDAGPIPQAKGDSMSRKT